MFSKRLADKRLASVGGGDVATWVLPEGWTQPIPVTQFEAQYPWMMVDERGQIHLQPDYQAWLEQRAKAKENGAVGLMSGGIGGAGGSGGVVPDGGAGSIPPSQLNTGASMGGTSGLGTSAFGNGVAAGAAAHV